MDLLKSLFKDRSFVYKFALLTTIPVIIVAISIALIATKTLELSVTETTNIRIKRNTSLAALSLSSPYVIYNKALLDSFVDSLKQEKDTIYAFIVDYNDGRILVHSDHSRDGQRYESDESKRIQLEGTGSDGISQLIGSSYEAVSPIRIGGDVFGTIKVGYTLDSVHKKILSLRMKIIGITGIAIVFSLILSVILARFLGNPLLSLASKAQEMVEGNFEQEIVYDSKDVVGKLSLAFKKMGEELKKKMGVIEKINEELEERVDLRTRELKIANREIQESEERFRSIAAAASSAIIMIDQDGTIQFWNKAAHKIFGWQEDEAVGKDVHALLAPEQYRSGYEKGLASFKKTGQGPIIGKTIELQALRKDKQEIIIEIAITSVQLKGHLNAVGILNDITARKTAEGKLQQNIKELERFSKMAVGREMQMIKLKKEINQLLVNQGQKEKYNIVK